MPSTHTNIFALINQQESDCFHHFSIARKPNGIPLVPNQSENGKYNLISVWFNKILKRFLYMYDVKFKVKLQSKKSNSTNIIYFSQYYWFFFIQDFFLWIRLFMKYIFLWNTFYYGIHFLMKYVLLWNTFSYEIRYIMKYVILWNMFY